MSKFTEQFPLKILTFISLVTVFLYLFAESNLINNKNILFVNATLTELILASLALTLLLWSFPTRLRTRWLKTSLISLKSLLIFAVLFMVFAEAAVVDFSGMLFGPEAIVHFSWDAFILGVNEYLWLFLAVLLFLALTVLALVYSSHILLSITAQITIFVVTILLFAFAFEHSVLGRYAKGINRYLDLNHLQSVSEKQLESLKPLGISKLAVTKSAITAQRGNNKNLVVIYLESFSEIFTTTNRYPGLTPNINRLKSEYVALHPYVSTSKFTMDGLIGSLCGFLPNMTLGNNALTDTEKHYYTLPCMTDVLKKAGYYQEFFGGAKKSFANKGTFLTDHGYDRVWGWEDFEHQENYKEPGSHSWWGLHDDDLFNLATNKIKQLHRAKKPFHISILTVATHLKGFSAPTCLPYQENADRFIDAIHCADQLLGQFINQLETHGILENTVVFITGDHSVFNTSLTKELFGEGVNDKNLLGIMIDKKPQSNHIPMGLYDMAPVLLDRLEIDHNVTFINGQSNVYSGDRLLLTRSDAFKNGLPIKLNPVCNENDALDPNNLNACTHRRSINTQHGYSQLFKLDQSLKYQSGASLKITFSEDRTEVKSILLNNSSIKDHFSRNGFKLNSKNFSSPDLFYIQFDPENKSISKTFLLDMSRNPLGTINYLTSQSKLPFMLFGVQNALTDFKQEFNDFESFSCPNELLCINQINHLGNFEQNKSNSVMSLVFAQPPNSND